MVSIKCGKCDGTGRIECFGHYDNGKCFECMGAGTVTGVSRTAKQIARMNAIHEVEALIEAREEGCKNTTWMTYMSKRAAANMLTMQDRPCALKLLARLPRDLRNEVIEAGRAEREKAAAV
jgi:hypothetical protein